ncbi:PREDICTED: thyroglobulin-like, partial [Gekko japonicus]|uniref:Thyroglobulin-like n=1 Tax=Gekko japonicus TaxID=146911 RepID=A0ABM1JS85_GEKJA
PQCHLPFDPPDVVNGQVFCNNSSSATTITQQCRVICYPGFHSAFSSGETFLCDVETSLWVGDPPHSQTCQKLQPFQSVQTQSHFQLLLPPEKTCSPDYSGLLEAFQIFILDEMKARGLCHVQANTLERLVSVPICGDSAVRVECLSADRLGVNVTWTAVLEDIPAASLPDLHNIEEAMVGDLMGRFESLIRNRGFVFHLDSKRFQADTSIHFLRDVDLKISSGVYLGCVTACQMDKRGLRCDESGQYEPYFEDSSTNKSFCVDSLGKILEWTETDSRLTAAQCLVLRRFESVPASKLSVSTDEAEMVRSETIQGEPSSALWQCVAGQEFTTAGAKTFERTDFQDVVSGVYRNLVLPAAATSLTDVHLFCRQGCSQDPCCDGFILSQVLLDGESTLELFSLMESSQIQLDQRRSLPSQEYRIFKHTYSAEEARLWCLTRCAEDEFCHLVDIPNVTSQTYFTCTLYPVAQVCENIVNSIPENCSTVLPQKPNILFQKKVSLEGSVKNFYTRLPFRKVSGISVRNKMDVSGKAVGDGSAAAAVMAAEQWRSEDVATTDGGGAVTARRREDAARRSLRDISRSSRAPEELHLKLAVWVPLHNSELVALDQWQRVDKSSVLIDPSVSQFDILHLSKEAASGFASARDICLSGSSLASGNWGLLDQEAALKWTQDNIASFGGDPSQITTAADRSGADIASLHLVAGARDSGLFKRALLMMFTKENDVTK